MSFILDALKKSEADRQRQAHPESAYVSSQSPARSPNRWVWIVAALLAVNVLVLIAFLLMMKTPAAVVTPATGPSATGVAGTSTTTAPQAVDNTATDDVSFRDRVAEAKRNRPLVAEPVRQPAIDTAAPRAAPQVVAADTTPSTLTTAYKTFNEARVDGSVVLPELHLDIHVYSASPAERFVFINMEKIRENGVLAEGPRVVEIVPDGAILEYSGTRFLLPRD